MEFKNKKLEQEWKNVFVPLQNIIAFAERHVTRTYEKGLTVTGLNRTHKKSIEIYAGKIINPKTGKEYKPEEVPFSVHETLPCRGVDCRSANFTEYELLELVNHVNNNFTYDPSRPAKKCCLVHDVGLGLHLHFQGHAKTELVAVQDQHAPIPIVKETNMSEKLKSRKLWITIITAALTTINAQVRIVPEAQLQWIIGLIGAYVLGQSGVDALAAKKG